MWHPTSAVAVPIPALSGAYPRNVMTVGELQLSFSRAKRSKGMSCDGSCDDVFKAFPSAAAAAYHPLMAKMAGPGVRCEADHETLAVVLPPECPRLL